MSTKLRGICPSRRFFALGAFALCAVLVSTTAFGEYVELPCLKTTGEQWINTLYIPLSTDRVEMKFRMTVIDAKQTLYCSRGTAANQSTFTAFSYTANKYIGFDFGSNSYGQGYYGAAISENQLVTVSAKNKEFKVNGSTSQSASGSFTGISPFSLFAAHLAGADLNAETPMSNYAKMIFYYFRVYDKDNNLVCDCVPVRDTEAEAGSVKEYGLYDRVAKRFLPNNGTAAFVTQKTITVGTETELIAAGAAANPGDTVLVKDGTYKFEETVKVGLDVTVKSVNGKGSTFVEAGTASVRAFDVKGGHLEGFTFRNFSNWKTALVHASLSGYVIACDFLDNSRTGDDRGVVCCGGCTVSRCRFIGNAGPNQAVYAAALAAENDNVNYIENSLFENNRSGYGGAINGHSGAWTVRNCDFFGNQSYKGGGDIFGDWDFLYHTGKTVKFYNCIIQHGVYYPKCRQQMKTYVVSDTSKRTQFFNCQVGGIDQAGYAYCNFAVSTGNMNLPNPGFADLVLSGYHLDKDSPMIGAGVPVTYSDTANVDLDGVPRPAKPSIGCYEYNADAIVQRPVLYVSPTGDGSDGSTWEKAYNSPSEALAVAADGTDIKVAAGTYEIAATLNVTKPVRLIGVEGRDKTTLRAAAKGYRVVRLANRDAVVQGFTIRDGDTTSDTTENLMHGIMGGAGVGISTAGGELLDCRITNCRDTNTATFPAHRGGGIAATGGHISRCIIDGNYGGVDVVDLLATSSGCPYMDNCLIVNNAVASGATAVRVRTATLETWSSLYDLNAPIQLFDCTVLCNTGATASVQRELKGGRICNVIMQNVDKTAKAWLDTASDAETATNVTSTIWRNCASYVPVGTNCVSGVDLKLRSNGRPYFSSPCKEAGFIHLFATGPYAGDVNGDSRIIEKDGEEVIDIGCYQLGAYGPGLMLLVR